MQKRSWRTDMPEDSPEQELARIRKKRRLQTLREIELAAQSRDPTVIPLLIRTLRHKKEGMRRAAANALPLFGEPAFQALLSTLASGKKRQKEMAVKVLGEWGDRRAVEPLLQAIREAERKWSSVSGLGCLFFLLFHWLAVVMYVLANAAVISLQDTSQIRIEAVEALGRLGDLRAVSHLARMARSRERNTALFQTTCDTLIALLPEAAMFTPDQAEQLGPEAVANLTLLLTSENTVLVHSVLHTLRAVGNERSIPAVLRLQKDRGQPESTCALAADVLRTLQERAAQAEARQTLLRGASATDVTVPQELLRAASYVVSSTDPPEQLLRAGQEPENSP